MIEDSLSPMRRFDGHQMAGTRHQGISAAGDGDCMLAAGHGALADEEPRGPEKASERR